MSHTDSPSTYVCPRCDQQVCICHWYDEPETPKRFTSKVPKHPMPEPAKEERP